MSDQRRLSRCSSREFYLLDCESLRSRTGVDFDRAFDHSIWIALFYMYVLEGEEREREFTFVLSKGKNTCQARLRDLLLQDENKKRKPTSLRKQQTTRQLYTSSSNCAWLKTRQRLITWILRRGIRGKGRLKKGDGRLASRLGLHKLCLIKLRTCRPLLVGHGIALRRLLLEW